MGKKQIEKTRVSNSKRIKSPAPLPASDLKKTPLFSFEYMDDEYSISNCDKTEKASFAETLRILGKCTWGELLLGNRHANGYEKIRIDSIKGKYPSVITPDVDHVIAFRFHDRKPVVGLKIRQIFYIIWLDSKMNLYQH